MVGHTEFLLMSMSSRVTGERALEQLNYSLIKGRAWYVWTIGVGSRQSNLP